MVNDGLTDARAAERRVALSYARAEERGGLEALLALDATLGGIVRTTREPLVGQMRLTWWHDALTALGKAPPPAEPVLAALSTRVVGKVGGNRLAEMIEGWEALLDPLDRAAVDRAAARGAVLFDAMAAVLGGGGVVADAGRGWAYADLSRHLSDPALATHARERGRLLLGSAMAAPWPARLRSLGALALLARDDVAERAEPPGGWRRVGRLVLHRLTGR